MIWGCAYLQTDTEQLQVTKPTKEITTRCVATNWDLPVLTRLRGGTSEGLTLATFKSVCPRVAQEIMT